MIVLCYSKEEKNKNNKVPDTPVLYNFREAKRIPKKINFKLDFSNLNLIDKETHEVVYSNLGVGALGKKRYTRKCSYGKIYLYIPNDDFDLEKMNKDNKEYYLY